MPTKTFITRNEAWLLVLLNYGTGELQKDSMKPPEITNIGEEHIDTTTHQVINIEEKKGRVRWDLSIVILPNTTSNLMSS